jgi:dipeptidyl aminopeptidase/acylaminoacyl peptidase
MDNAPNELFIELTTWADVDNDYKLEEHKHPLLRVEKGDTIYTGDFGDEIYVPIYNVPATNPPEKYTVVVQCGKDLVSESITIPSAQQTSGHPTPSHVDWTKPWRIPMQIAERLSTLTGIFRIMRDHTIQDMSDKGISNLFVYDLERKQLIALTRNTHEDVFYESPVWSSDGQKIATVITQDGNKRIVLIDVKDQSARDVTDGGDDSNPLWCPDSRHLLFLRKDRLYLVETEQPDIRPIAVDFPVTELLAVSWTQEDMPNILYKAPKFVSYNDMRVDTGKLAVYLLELDNQFNPCANGLHELRGDKIWMFSKLIAPSGEQIVYTDVVNTASMLFVERIDNTEKKQLFKDEYNYYEPAWSPDGTKIVVVSDRP